LTLGDLKIGCFGPKSSVLFLVDKANFYRSL